MTDYSNNVSGNIEWLAKSAFAGILKNNLDVGSITTNVRMDGDTTDDRSMPGISVDALAEKTLPGVPEYLCGMEFIGETMAAVDTTGDQVDALVGAVRDVLNAAGFLAALNKQQRGIVFHDVRETATLDDDEIMTKVRRRVVQADAWCYPGRATAA